MCWFLIRLQMVLVCVFLLCKLVMQHLSATVVVVVAMVEAEVVITVVVVVVVVVVIVVIVPVVAIVPVVVVMDAAALVVVVVVVLVRTTTTAAVNSNLKPANILNSFTNNVVKYIMKWRGWRVLCSRRRYSRPKLLELPLF